MIRFILIALLLILYLVVLIPIMLVLLIWRQFDRLHSSLVAQRMVAGVFRLMIMIGGAKVEIVGRENIPTEEGVLFVSNHRSYFDILVGFGYTKKIMGFVAKAEMEKYPLLNVWMTLVNCLFLDRVDMKKGLKTILKGIENIKAGYSVWICPEGTRNKTDDPLNMAEFKEGSLKLAEKSRCYIVPVAITGTRELFERQLPRIVPSHIVVTYGSPYRISDLPEEDRKKAGSYTRDIIYEMLKKQM